MEWRKEGEGERKERGGGGGGGGREREREDKKREIPHRGSQDWCRVSAVLWRGSQPHTRSPGPPLR